MGPGVHDIKYDDAGHVQSFKIVGTSRVSTVLGIAKGKNIAIQRAKLNAKVELVKWLKEKVASVEKNQDETIIQLKGQAGGELSEEGKETEHLLAQVDSIAEEIIRGTITLNVTHAEHESDGTQNLHIVLGWSKKTNQAAKEVSAALAEPVNANDMTSDKPAIQTGPKQKIKMNIPPKSVTSPAAADF